MISKIKLTNAGSRPLRIAAGFAIVASIAVGVGIGGTPAAGAADAPQPTASATDNSLTVVARLCPSFQDVQANRSRNNLQETYSDLGIAADPPYTSNMADDPISPERENSANADGYQKCKPIPNWTFTLGRAPVAYGTSPNVRNSAHISTVSGALGTTKTQQSTPELNDAGQYVDAKGAVVPGPDQAAQIPGAVTVPLTGDMAQAANAGGLWLQGGKVHDYPAGASNTNKYQVNADEPQFAFADGSPRYAFAALRCVTDDLNGDNAEVISLNKTTRTHGYCFAYYVGPQTRLPGTITVLKKVTSPSGNGKAFNLNGNVSFTPGSGDATTDPFTVVAGSAGTSFTRAATADSGRAWTVQESAGANPGWQLDSLKCTTAGKSTFSYSKPSGGVNSLAAITLAPDDHVTCTATNSPAHPPNAVVTTSATVRKIDETSKQVLSGATFALFREGDRPVGTTSELVGTCTTDAHGTCSVSGLTLGDYRWIETHAPRGYELNSTSTPLTISTAAGSHVTTVVDKRTPTPQTPVVTKPGVPVAATGPGLATPTGLAAGLGLASAGLLFMFAGRRRRTP